VLSGLQGSDEGLRRAAAAADGVDLPPACLALWPGAWQAYRHGLAGVTDDDLLTLRGPHFAAAAHLARRRRLPSSDEAAAALPLVQDEPGRLRWLRALGRPPIWPRLARQLDRRLWAPQPRPGPPPRAAAEPAPAVAAAPPLPPTSRQPIADATVVFTIATGNYLPYVRVLMASLRVHQPTWHRIVLLADDGAPVAPGDAELFESVPAASLGLPTFDDMRLRYDVVEFSTALKPHFMRHAFALGAREIVYLDPDIRLYQPLQALTDLLAQGHAMVLTPHLNAPWRDDHEPSDHTVLKSGVFNLGFAAFSRQPQARAFADWWAERLCTGARVDLAANLFTDQRWCDMAPAFVPGLAILRHAGYNAAYWNLGQRGLVRDALGQWHTHDGALAFYHFSGLDPERPQSISRYQDRYDWSALSPLHPLFEDYAAEVRAGGWAKARRAGHRHDAFDGLPLPPLLRAWYTQQHPQPAGAPRQALQHLVELARPEPGVAADTALSPLMRYLHGTRTDLQLAFDLSQPALRQAYAGWFWSVGIVQHRLAGYLVQARARLAAG